MIKEDAQSKPKRGRTTAQLLAGSWRASPPLTANSAQELEEVAALLMKSGAGGLAWNRIRRSALRDSPIAGELEQSYRLGSLHAALHERSLKMVIPLLRSYGVEPLLVKGWAIARHYAESGLRQYCDLDLCVLPDHFTAASTAMKDQEDEFGSVDLHLGFDKFYDRQTEDVFARSKLVNLDEVEVRVLCAEDDLRFLCLHLLRHGAIRPLWLCDIAVLLETRPDNFDWDLCLGHSPQQADWVACAVGLAHELLGVDVKATPVASRARNLPSWLVPAVLKEWGTPFQSLGQIAVRLRNPVRRLRELIRELPHHWPNPIEATMTLKGPFNELPRLPFQVGHVFSRTAALMSQLRS